MSRQSAHISTQRPGAKDFRAAWDAALDCAIPAIESAAWERCIKGGARPILYKGEQVGECGQFDERLTMFLLRFRRAHRYRDLSLPTLERRPPSIDEEILDPDEAIQSLDLHVEDLVDEDELLGGENDPPRAYDGVNFVNFVGFSSAASAAGSRDDRNDYDARSPLGGRGVGENEGDR